MLGAVGALIPEGLSMAGVELGEPVWWKVRRNNRIFRSQLLTAVMNCLFASCAPFTDASTNSLALNSQVGAAKLNSDLTLNWGGIEGFRIAGKQGIGIIAACQVNNCFGLRFAWRHILCSKACPAAAAALELHLYSFLQSVGSFCPATNDTFYTITGCADGRP